MYREKEERKEGSTRGRTEHCSKMGDKLSFFYGGGGGGVPAFFLCPSVKKGFSFTFYFL